MTRKNLSLLRRSNNRTHRPARTQSSEEDNDVGSDDATMQTGEGRRPRRASSSDSRDPTGKLYVDRVEKDTDWLPALSSVFKILFSMRVSAAIWSALGDCDEVYNYWEPLHLLLYGRGFQTWEYSPVYAIRSWFYIVLHMLPARALNLVLGSSKIAVFITMRCVIGAVNVIADLCVYHAIAARLGNGVARFYIAFSMLAAGMFVSSCAFLPSSFSMSLNAFAFAAYLSRKWWLSIFATAASAMVGWPFAAVLGLPVVIEMLVVQPRRLAQTFAIYASVAFVVLAAALVAVDSYFYGTTVLAPLNIVLYNMFSSHGPDLYGVEPTSFYVKNLLLNWNVAFPLAILALPASALVYWRGYRNAGAKIWAIDFSLSFWRRLIPVASAYATLLLWLAIFFAQAHKEERFLYPVYPFIALCAAIALDALHRLGLATFVRRRYAKHWHLVVGMVMALFALLALSRTIALHRNFAAPIETYKALNEHLVNENFEQRFRANQLADEPIRVCVGKEWYRFPSSFFLPDSVVVDRDGRRRAVVLEFVRSEFAGLLPKAFARGELPGVTRGIPSEMNDANREESSRYVSIDVCDYLVDLETPDVAPLEPNYAQQTTTWRSLDARPFLLAARSHWFFRAFYVPFLSNRFCVFGRYHVLQRIDYNPGEATGL